MSTTLYYWRVYCTTDGTYEFLWAETEPNYCPENTTHSIDQSKTTIIDQIKENLVEIKETEVPTGGNFKTETKKITVSANSTKTTDYTFPIPIGFFSIHYVTKAEHEGDVASLLVSPNTSIGVISQDINSGSTIIPVNSNAIKNVILGYYVTLNDGTNTNDLGQIINIDKQNSTITVENATTVSFQTSTPTVVEVTRVSVDNMEIGPPAKYEIGTSKIGGSYIPANTTIRVIYTNNGSSQITIIFRLEYTY